MYENVPDEVDNVIVTGKSGAGKQPRIDVLVEEYGLEQLSTGDIFRSYLGEFDGYGYDGDISQFWDEEKEEFVADDRIAEEIGTDKEEVILGLKAKYFVDRGKFVPDRITNQLFDSYFGKQDYSDQVLDGYPRTVDQADFLLDLVEEKNTKVDFILWVRNTDEKIIARTTKRRICPECGEVYHLKYDPPEDGKCADCGVEVIQRSDDTEEKIRARLQEFKDKTKPMIEYLDGKIPIAEVSGHLEEFTPENVRKSVMSSLEELYE
ncbi:MAG: nucleoside monophosphate kinase [Candidatus Thermoplasmatota archaeon]|nr:nucleoside monophosphate kinase [Candidatus Thermoplasmatota archaeon]